MQLSQMKVPFFSIFPLLGLLSAISYQHRTSTLTSSTCTMTSGVGLTVCCTQRGKCDFILAESISCGRMGRGTKRRSRGSTAGVPSKLRACSLGSYNLSLSLISYLMHTMSLPDALFSFQEAKENRMDRLYVWTECGICRTAAQ